MSDPIKDAVGALLTTPPVTSSVSVSAEMLKTAVDVAADGRVRESEQYAENVRGVSDVTGGVVKVRTYST